MVWTMSEIIKPRVMQKLQEEIRRCVKGKASVEESDIAQMPNVKLVVKEALRLHSTVPFLLTRECVKQCQIGGYDIYLGTRVLINAWGIGRDPKVWTETAFVFNPERLENAELDRSEMIPIGGGRRACPASSVATQVLSSGMKNQELDMEEVGSLIVVRKTPLCLVPIKHDCIKRVIAFVQHGVVDYLPLWIICQRYVGLEKEDAIVDYLPEICGPRERGWSIP
ncbi:hypothetical protein LXL04_030047 [Taraxacum kok-saghyz]